jgi:hypothetical protein
MKISWRWQSFALLLNEGVIMKWSAQRDVVTANPSHLKGEWDRWFAWYPVIIATSRHSARWVWLEFVERKWSRNGGGSKRRRYRLLHKDVRQRLHNLKELTQKLDDALSQSRPSLDLMGSPENH